MKSLSIAAALVAVARLVSAVSAATIGTGYTQNFNGMGTGTTIPDGWAGYNITGTHDQFKPADDPTGTGALPTGNDIKAGTAVTTFTAVTPSNQKSAATLYNWAIGGSPSERALGTSPTGNAGMILQLTLTNDQPAPITNLSIAYDVRVLSTTVMNNSYPSNNYAGGTIEELPGYRLFYSLDNGATYTNVTALNADGHTWANALGTVNESIANLTLTSPWISGSNIQFRWFDDNAQGPSPDQLLGLDNVAISAVPEPASLGLLALGALAFISRRR